MSDTQAPQILNATLNTATLDPSTAGGAFLAGTIEFSDDQSGLEGIYLSYKEATSGQQISLDFYISENGGDGITGNALNGTITSSRQLDRFAASGDWSLERIETRDQAGNSKYLSSYDETWSTQLDKLNIKESARSFTVDNSGADTQAPQILNATLNTATLDPSTAGGAFLAGTIEFSDDQSGLEGIYLSYKEATSGQQISLDFYISENGGDGITGNALNGTITSSRQLDRFAASGDWSLERIETRDQAGNSEYLSSYDETWSTQLDKLNIKESARSFTVDNSGADTQAPQILNATLNTATLDPSTAGGAFLAGTIEFSDDQSGLEGIYLSYKEATSGQQISLDFYISENGGDGITGNALNGTITSSRQLDRFAASGDWSLERIETRDQAGNSKYLSSYDETWSTQLDKLNIKESARSFTVDNSGAELLSQADTSAPNITGLNLNATTFDPSQPGGAYLTTSVSFTDDASGFNNLSLRFESVDTDQEIYVYLSDYDTINGTLLEGSVAASQRIDPFAANGEYVLSNISGSDNAGNNFNYYKGDSDWQQFLSNSNIQQSSFSINSSQADTSAPNITGLNLNATTFDPSQPGGAYLTTSVSFTDDASGFNNLSLRFESVDTDQEIYVYLSDYDTINGTLLEGSVAASQRIDPFAANGEYVLSNISGSDNAGNNFNYYKGDSDWQQFLSNSNIQQSSFSINSSQADTSAPNITGLNLNATTFDPSQPGGAYLTTSVSFTDDASGFNNLSLRFESVDTDQEIYVYLSDYDTINGTLLEGSVAASQRIDPFAANGEYVLSNISGSDNAGNNFNYYKGDSDWEQFLSSSNIQQSSFFIDRSESNEDPVDANADGLVDNRSVYTLFNNGDPLTLLKERSDGSTRTFSAKGIPNWDATQAVNAEDNSGNFYVLLEGAVETERTNQFKVWTTDNTGLISSETGWRSAEQLAQDGWEERFNTDFNGDELIGTPVAVDANADGLVDNRSVYTLFNNGDPLTLLKERSDGTTRTFSAKGIPNWDATQAVNAEDNSGNFYVLLEGAVETERTNQFKVWTTDNTGLISSETGWRSAEQLAQDGWEERFNTDFNGDELIGTPVAVDANADGLVDNRSVYTLFNNGDPLTLLKERSDGSTRTFSAKGIPNWDATQAVNAEDNSGNFYVLLEGAVETERTNQFKVWTTDNTGLIKSSTGWQSAEQFAQDDLGQLFSIDIAVDADNNGLEDTTPPELLSYTLSDYNIDLSDGDVTIDVTAAIRDDISGVFDGTFANGSGGSASQATWTSPSGTQSVLGGSFDDPVTGDFLNGTYTNQAVFNQFSENGTWTLDNFLVVDEAGNSTYLSTDQLNELGIQTTLEVIGGMSDLIPNSTEILA